MPLFGKPTHVPTCRIYPLQFRKIWKKIIVIDLAATPQGKKLWRSIILSILALGGVYTVLSLATPRATPLNPIALLAPIILPLLFLLLFTAIYEWLYIWTYYFDLHENFVVIRKGVMVRRELTVPYQRIQDVYVDQDVLDVIFHLYDVHISTATDMSSVEAHIDGLSSTNARIIRDKILERVASTNKVAPGGE